MTKIVSSIILIFALCFMTIAQKKHSKYSNTRSNLYGKSIAENQLNDFFKVFFYGLKLQTKPIKKELLQLSKSNEQDVLAFLKKFPNFYNKVTNELDSDERYRFIQADSENHFLVFSIGNEENKWRDKLYNTAFNITFPNKKIAEDETEIYKKLNQMYGEFTKIEKFRYDSEEESDLNLYIWELPNTIITYRSYYNTEQKQGVIVVEYWDREFYKTYPYYNF